MLPEVVCVLELAQSLVVLVRLGGFAKRHLLEGQYEESHSKGEGVNLFWDVRTLSTVLFSQAHLWGPILFSAANFVGLPVDLCCLSEIDECQGKIILDHNIVGLDVSVSEVLMLM